MDLVFCKMELFGIKFVPFRESLRNTLQALAAGAWFILVVFAGILSLHLCIYLLFTRVWWLVLLYFLWIYWDRDVCERGGRPSKWVQNCAWANYVKDYFSAHCSMVTDFNLDPKRNYLFCCFPHGVLPAGPYFSLTLESGDFYRQFPEFQVRISTLKLLFYLPFTRDVGLAMGGISSSVRSLNYVLRKPEGGYVVILFPGGAEESMYAKSGRYKFVLINRKGFVKRALTCGSPLVPVVTFGEPDCFDQIQGPRIFKFQNSVKKYTGWAPIFFRGRGLFQLNFGCIPRKTSLTTVVGRPIEVKKNENPTNEEIDNLHQKFMEELRNLFEKSKHEYLTKPKDTFLELV